MNNALPWPFWHYKLLSSFATFHPVSSIRSVLPPFSLSAFSFAFTMVGVSAARILHAANTKRVNELVNQLKEARAKMKVSGEAVAREVAQEERMKLAKLTPKPKASVAKVIKVAKKQDLVCKPFVPAKRGRPSSGECNACKRLLLGKKGGKPHICGRVPYSRIG